MDWSTLDLGFAVAVLGLAAALGEARFKVSDLRERMREVEKQHELMSKNLAGALEQLRLDVREIKTVLELLRGRDRGRDA